MSMERSPVCQLPYIMPSQAQKHVTHNEAVAMLDVLVQMSIIDRDLPTPPGTPEDGDRYIVAAAPTGDWAGHAGEIAYRRDGGWFFMSPRPGWLAWLIDEASLVYWTGTAWEDFASGVTILQNLARSASARQPTPTNPFSAKVNKALWTARTAAEGGNGDLRYTLNKETAANVLSLLLQDGFSGRAELGLVGDDNLSLKVSPDGSAWTTALSVDRTTGQASMAALSLATDLSLADGGTGASTASGARANLGLGTAAVANTGTSGATVPLLNGANSFSGNLTISGTTTSFTNQGSATFGGTASATRYLAISNFGRITSRYDDNGVVIPVSGQNFGITGLNQGGRFEFYFGTGGVQGGRAASIDFLSTADWSGSANQSAKFSIALMNAGSSNERFTIMPDGEMRLSGTAVIDANQIFRLRSYTVGALPSAATAAGQMILCSDLGGGAGQLNSDGTNWRRTTPGQQTVATNANYTLTVLVNAENQRHTGTLTANRTVTLSTTNAYAGASSGLPAPGAAHSPSMSAG